MEQAYHLPPILSPVKGVRTNNQPASNCFREPGKTKLPPLKRVVTPIAIEKEKIETPRQEHDQHHVAKRKRKKKRNRCRSHDPRARVESEVDKFVNLSQSVRYNTRFVNPSLSSPRVISRQNSVFSEVEEFDPQTAIDLPRKCSDELQGETPSRICEEPCLRNGAKMQSKARNTKTRNLEQQKHFQVENVENENSQLKVDYVQTGTANSVCTKENGPSLIQVLSSDQSNVRREGKDEYLDEVEWTDKCFHQKRRGTRIVQLKEHPHPVYPLEFHPHPPPQFRTTTCKTQHVAMMPHQNLPATADPSLNLSSLARIGHSQVRPVCMHGESISSVTSEFHPHPPLQPRSFINPTRQCHSLSDCQAIPLEGQTGSSGHFFRNTSPTLNKSHSQFPIDIYPDRCSEEPRPLCKNVGHHSYRSAGSSPVLSGFAPHMSRDYLIQSQLCPPASPVNKTFHLKNASVFNSNRVCSLADTNHAQDVQQNTASPSNASVISEPLPYIQTGICLPANYQWAIIDDSGSVTPLSRGTFPAPSKKVSEEPNEGSPESSFDSFPPSSLNIPAPHLPLNIKKNFVDEIPELQTSTTHKFCLDSPCANASPKRERRCFGLGIDEERPPEKIFEKVPSPKNAHWTAKRGKGAIMNASQSRSSCKPFASSVLDSPRARKSNLSLTEMPNEHMKEFSTNDQPEINASAGPNGEKKQRNFKLPIGWYSNSKSWFKSPFKKEKKHHRKTSTMPPQKTSQLPPLLTIDEFSSLNISDERKSKSPETADKHKDKKKRSVYTLGEFLKLCDEDDEAADGIFD